MLKSSILWALSALLLFTAIRADMTYSVVNSYTDPSHTFYTALLKYDGNDTTYINQTNTIIQNLNFTYFFVSTGHLIVRVTDANNSRWEVPYLPPYPHVDLSKKVGYDSAAAKISVTESPFSFKVTRASTNEVIFDTSLGDFIYSDYYIQLSTSLATSNIYGLGERAYKLNLGPDGTYSIFTKDNPGNVEDGTSGNNLYGYHPVYLLREQSNEFNMVLLRSSLPMDVVIQGGQNLTYKVIGGIVDLNFFLGEPDTTPEAIVKQYHTYLGGWTLQPFWSFGFHQCRWGYKSVGDLVDVLSNYSANHLPLDVIWSDINYMDAYTDFTVDDVNFPPGQMIDMLETYQKRWVPIIDAGVALNNSIHTMGLTNNVYLKDPNGTYLEGVVWPGNVNYPDFMNPNTSLFWYLGLNGLYEQIPFSGIWNDMNEASNFVPGEVGFVADDGDILNNPPYKPAKPWEFIYTKTERMDAVHYGGILEYYVHNLFGFFEAKATYNFLKIINDLVFILTRSSFYGSGQWAAHWTGDNVSTFRFLALSIPGIINSGFYGMPLTGADICGFSGDTTPELCARWFQLGSLYPFSRDHNTDGALSQEPYALGPTVLQTARVSLALRYSIVRHYYTQFLKQSGTGTIFRPVFFEFPTDENFYNSSLNYTDSQFLIGSSLMVAPVLEQGVENVTVYFPQGAWYDYIDGTLVQSAEATPSTISYPAPLNATAPIFIRGGYIVPNQDVTNVNRTDDLDNVYQLVIATQPNGQGVYEAKGELVGIANFSDSNVLVKCRDSNCLYSLDAKVTVTNDNYNVVVSFAAQGPTSNYEAVSISSLFMMGEWQSQTESLQILSASSNGMEVIAEQVSNGVIRYAFNPPFSVTPGAQIQVSGTLPSSLIEI